MIGETISHYRILEKLGEGGMGVVYKAEDTKLKRTVALKFLPPEMTRDPEVKQLFIHEAQAASAPDHINICTIYEIDETDDGKIFIAMAYCDGEVLKERIDRGPLMLEEAMDIASQIAQGLAKAHEQGIVHRDVKPANVLITKDGVARIADFGLAKLRGQTKITKEGATLGTVSYMSPEQARGQEVDHQTDIWSLGVVLYEMLTGQLPFKGDYEQAVIYSIVNEKPKPMGDLRSDVPLELEKIVGKALQKETTRRYQRMGELLGDLKDLRDRLTPKGVATHPPFKFKRRFTAPILVFLIVALALVVGIRIQVGRQSPVMAEENRLAVMYFDNLADPEDPQRFGEIITNLLITDLSESRYVQVVSSQRLYDILKLLGKEGAKVVDREVATQVATKAGAKRMLLGNILQVEPQIVITSHLNICSRRLRRALGRL